IISNNANGSLLLFSNASTAGNATIINNPDSTTNFEDTSTAANATINNTRGNIQFAQASSAGNATITNNSGGSIGFFDNSTGGNARFITNAGGEFDMSDVRGGMTAGSIEGAGSYFLGSNTLTVGSNNLSTEVSGVSLVKVGSGTLTLSGINTYTGATTVNGGTLVVDGSIATSLLGTVTSGAMLAGIGTVGKTLVAAGGTVAPGSAAGGAIGTLHVADNLLVGPGAFYAVDVNGLGRSDRIAATGAANLGGGTVQVTAINSLLVNTPYTILTASGGVTNTFSGAVGSFAFFTPNLTYDPNDVFLTFARNNVSFASAGQTRNQVATGAGLDSLGRGPAVNAVVASSTPAQARLAFDQLSGELHASTAGVMLDESRYVRDAVLGRLRQPFGRPDGSFAAIVPIGSQAVAVDGCGALG